MRRAGGGQRGTKAPLWGRREGVASPAAADFGGGLPHLPLPPLPGPCLPAGGAGMSGEGVPCRSRRGGGVRGSPRGAPPE